MVGCGAESKWHSRFISLSLSLSFHLCYVGMSVPRRKGKRI